MLVADEFWKVREIFGPTSASMDVSEHRTGE